MNESSFKIPFIKRLKSVLLANDVQNDIIYIESPTMRGIADVNFNINGTPGWIEFKYLDKWPKGFVKLPCYTLHQYDFLINRGRLHESTHLIIRIEDDIIISSYPNIIEPSSRYSKIEMMTHFKSLNASNINFDLIIQILTKHYGI